MIADLIDVRAAQLPRPSILAQIAEQFENHPFTPVRWFRHGDTQTLAAYLWPARFRLRDTSGDEVRYFEVEPGSRVLARCRWQPDPTQHPTLVMWHGLEGSVASAYMQTTANKAFRLGFNAVRVNVRNCGATEHLTPTLYHGGLSGDLRAILDELIDRDRLPRIVIAGFSLGGNMVLKLAGEYGDDPPKEILAAGVISPSVDLQASCDLMNLRRNVVYHRDFLYYLKRRIKLKAKLYPDLYDSGGLREIRSIEHFDDRYVAPPFGFADARDYYARASALPYLSQIRIPTLIIHAQDDPFVPFAPLQGLSNISNPHLLLIAPRHGGHVAFVAENSKDEDRFWAENRLVNFAEVVGNR